MEFYERVRHGDLELARKEPGRMKVVDEPEFSSGGGANLAGGQGCPFAIFLSTPPLPIICSAV